MAKGESPPPRRSEPDYNPEPPAREKLGDDVPRVHEHQPERNRNAPAISVMVTVVVVLALGLLYFLFRG